MFVFCIEFCCLFVSLKHNKKQNNGATRKSDQRVGNKKQKYHEKTGFNYLCDLIN